MTTPAGRPPRADASRNAERIVHAARQAFAELGADVSLAEIARRSGVGVATLYRRFPNKEELITAVLRQHFAEQVEPAFATARADADPWRGMVTAFEATLTVAGQDRGILLLAPGLRAVTGQLAERLCTGLTEIALRAQRAGLVRADLEPADLPRLVVMVISSMRLSEPPTEDWRRYLALVLDALRPGAATPLPPAAPARRTFLSKPAHNSG